MKKGQESRTDWTGLGWCIVIIAVISALSIYIQFGSLILG